MNILPHKSYHVYNLKNKERVRKDEEKAQQEEAAKNKRKEIAERERRLKLLREKASAKHQLTQEETKEIATADSTKNDQALAIQSSSDATDGHINFWGDIEKKFATNQEYEAEKRAKEQKIERQFTMYFDEDMSFHILNGFQLKNADPRPWYLGTSNHHNDDEKYSIDGTIKKKRDVKTKSIDDPLLAIEKSMEKKAKKKNDPIIHSRSKNEKERNSISNSSSTIDELRAQRIAREREERMRTLKLLNPHMETGPPKSRYNSQFNPEATEAAHNFAGRRSQGHYRSDHSRSRRHKPY
ncbi:879_t:CDS:2 [Acaulospora morrowiae]|uniref:879_t:CDS:1 n=1 Tax=Acaulospora morrowiae TaxID=94023 RepID=A0A9N9H8I7_9GLOM|nr:879_t:CDS:2 [Acaulospora morrowiae]